jgi:hypothetical protein
VFSERSLVDLFPAAREENGRWCYSSALMKSKALPSESGIGPFEITWTEEGLHQLAVQSWHAPEQAPV